MKYSPQFSVHFCNNQLIYSKFNNNLLDTGNSVCKLGKIKSHTFSKGWKKVITLQNCNISLYVTILWLYTVLTMERLYLHVMNVYTYM